jgi:CAAX protease family protein
MDTMLAPLPAQRRGGPEEPQPAPLESPARTATRGIVFYLFITFGLAWIVWVPIALAGIDGTSGLAQVALWANLCTPAIAAIVVRRWITREGFADAGLHPHLIAAWPYYLIAWLWPLALIGVALALATIFGISILKNVSGDILPVLLTSLCAAPLFFGEEFGWRSYLQIRLFARTPLLAALATGAIWGVWHYPAALSGALPNENGILSLLLIPWWMIVFSIILGWLRLRTSSVWAPALAHSANNFIIPTLGVALMAGSPGLGDLLFSWRGALVAIPMVLLCIAIVLGGGLKPGRADTEVMSRQPSATRS